jgi:TetR/AcrR family transcriptional repressor of nem operon
MAAERARHPDLADLLARYLSAASRRTPGRGCPAAALGGDAARQPEPVRAEFAAGVEAMIDAFEARLAPDDQARRRAVNLLAKIVGALMLARAVPDGHPLATELLETCLAGCLEDVGLTHPDAALSTPR